MDRRALGKNIVLLSNSHRRDLAEVKERGPRTRRRQARKESAANEKREGPGKRT